MRSDFCEVAFSAVKPVLGMNHEGLDVFWDCVANGGGMEGVSPFGVTGSAIAGTYGFRAFSISMKRK